MSHRLAVLAFELMALAALYRHLDAFAIVLAIIAAAHLIAGTIEGSK